MTNKEQAVSDAVTDEMRNAGGSAVLKTAHLTGCERAEIIYLAMKAASHPLEQQQAVGDVVERVAGALSEQMENEEAQSLPSSMQRERGLIWLEGWFDLLAALTASGMSRMRAALERAAAIIGGPDDFDGLEDDDYVIHEIRVRVGDVKMFRTALQEDDGGKEGG